MRCCTTRSKSSCYFDLFIGYPLMFLDSILELFLLVMQGIVTLIPPVIPDPMNETLRIVRENCGGTWTSPCTLRLWAAR